ncbi:long-chain fatty acid--CoA ligase [Thermus igniterrae]|jgi:fatty-acyl-CoA synthase|uniref:long-chain fatty acid--CoA ligase n=1 Tax=Thermus igniterrae TaxID=88189 RepID=UPI000363BFAA|nr:long-chain fatty acid--CoA ligase [Thermus igniterrae]
MFPSTMMAEELNLWDFLERASELFPRKEVVSRLHTGEVHRTTYAEVHRRARRLMGGLRALGVGVGDRVATLGFNHFRHLEAYFAVPGMGAVLHTANPRLSPKEIAYILNHAEDRVLLFDPQLLPLVEALRPELRTVAHYVVMDQTAPEGYLAYEALLGEELDPVRVPERAACGMAYTTGTTGLPKGVVYSHRALVLHSLAANLTDGTALSEADVVLPVVPMFHVNAWCLPYAATLVGAKQVLPGPKLDPASLVELFDAEGVTFTAGVPTVWLALADHLEATGHRLRTLKRLVVGGSAAPRSLIARFEAMGVEVRQGYGLTETSPVVVQNFLKSHLQGLSEEEKISLKAKTGLPIPLIRLRVADEEGRPVPKDGRTMGEVQLKGPWITAGYYQNAEASRTALTGDGWFRTGDIAVWDEEGYLEIKDRLKDLIKSGGEWISSVDLENALMGHPQVKEAAVVAIPHPRWQERPLAVVVPRGERPSEEELQAHLLQAGFARWQLPDAYVFVEEIPRTSAGKFLKRALREQYKDFFQGGV